MTSPKTVHESEMHQGALACCRCGGWGHRWVGNEFCRVRMQCDRCHGTGDEPASSDVMAKET